MTERQKEYLKLAFTWHGLYRLRIEENTVGACNLPYLYMKEMRDQCLQSVGLEGLLD